MIKETHSFPLTSSIRPANNAAGMGGGCPAGGLLGKGGAAAAHRPSLRLPAGGLAPRGRLVCVPPRGRGGCGPPCSRWAQQRFSMGCVLTAAWVPPWPRSDAGSY